MKENVYVYPAIHKTANAKQYFQYIEETMKNTYFLPRDINP
jgi:hypothetical protein